MRRQYRIPGQEQRGVVGWPVLALSFLALGGVRAQTLRIPSGRTAGDIVAWAEAEAATYPRAPRSAVQRPLERRCVDAYDAEGMFSVRSGEFTIGGDLGGSPYAGQALRAGRKGKIWWQPDHGAPEMALIVRGRSLSSPQDTIRFNSTNVARPARGNGVRPVALEQRDYFFPSGIAIPRAGRWLVIATSGTNWGCFIIRVV